LLQNNFSTKYYQNSVYWKDTKGNWLALESMKDKVDEGRLTMMSAESVKQNEA
jgi:hypothetical protein